LSAAAQRELSLLPSERKRARGFSQPVSAANARYIAGGGKPLDMHLKAMSQTLYFTIHYRSAMYP
jgi:hypothetical protein